MTELGEERSPWKLTQKCRVDVFGDLMSDEKARLWRVKRSEKWVDFYRGRGHYWPTGNYRVSPRKAVSVNF